MPDALQFLHPAGQPAWQRPAALGSVPFGQPPGSHFPAPLTVQFVQLGAHGAQFPLVSRPSPGPHPSGSHLPGPLVLHFVQFGAHAEQVPSDCSVKPDEHSSHFPGPASSHFVQFSAHLVQAPSTGVHPVSHTSQYEVLVVPHFLQFTGHGSQVFSSPTPKPSLQMSHFPAPLFEHTPVQSTVLQAAHCPILAESGPLVIRHIVHAESVLLHLKQP